MKLDDFKRAMATREFRCGRSQCRHRWYSRDSRKPTRCPLCGEAAIVTVTGESLRIGAFVKRIDPVLKTLRYREREIVKLRFGIAEDRYCYTLKEVGQIFKLSPQRVHQLEARAIKKLREPARIEHLRKAKLFSEYSKLTLPNTMLGLLKRISAKNRPQ
jgi:RNA polymerase sigma factor (sigma-70 family)